MAEMKYSEWVTAMKLVSDMLNSANISADDAVFIPCVDFFEIYCSNADFSIIINVRKTCDRKEQA